MKKEIPENQNHSEDTVRISAGALAEVNTALEIYERQVDSTNLQESAKRTYILHAEHFVRWLRGDFEPGSRLK